jgi:hypothetical protein
LTQGLFSEPAGHGGPPQSASVLQLHAFAIPFEKQLPSKFTPQSTVELHVR